MTTRTACFFEDDPQLPLVRRVAAEGVGTLLLTMAATGGALAAARGGGDSAVASLVAAASIAGALAGLIVALGPVSGGHFNPLISVLQWLSGERTGRCAAAYVAAQVCGALLGATLGCALWPAAPLPDAPALLVFGASEAVASFSLMLVVFACARGGQRLTGPFAVGAWLFAAILATPSGSIANPAVALGAVAARGPLALTPDVALLAVISEVLGALTALAAIAIIGAPARAPRRLATVQVRS